MTYALLAALRTAQSYQTSAETVEKATIPPIEITLDGETIGKLAAPTVSKIIAENLRRQRFTP